MVLGNSEWIAVGSFIVAFVALIRPELTSLTSRWTNRIDFFPSKTIEIGFSDFGPTVGLHGTLRSIGNDQLIKSISVEVSRTRDNATYSFDWAVFRRFNLVQVDKTEIDPAIAFVIRKDDAKGINILFADRRTQDLFRDDLLDLRSKFQNFCEENNVSLFFKGNGDWNEAFENFRQLHNDDLIKVHQKLGSVFYWEAGEYEVTVTIHTDRPEKKFTFAQSFSISQEESESVQLNKVVVMNAACFYPNLSYNFPNCTLN